MHSKQRRPALSIAVPVAGILAGGIAAGLASNHIRTNEFQQKHAELKTELAKVQQEMKWEPAKVREQMAKDLLKFADRNLINALATTEIPQSPYIAVWDAPPYGRTSDATVFVRTVLGDMAKGHLASQPSLANKKRELETQMSKTNDAIYAQHMLALRDGALAGVDLGIVILAVLVVRKLKSRFKRWKDNIRKRNAAKEPAAPQPPQLVLLEAPKAAVPAQSAMPIAVGPAESDDKPHTTFVEEIARLRMDMVGTVLQKQRETLQKGLYEVFQPSLGDAMAGKTAKCVIEVLGNDMARKIIADPSAAYGLLLNYVDMLDGPLKGNGISAASMLVLIHRGGNERTAKPEMPAASEETEEKRKLRKAIIELGGANIYGSSEELRRELSNAGFSVRPEGKKLFVFYGIEPVFSRNEGPREIRRVTFPHQTSSIEPRGGKLIRDACIARLVAELRELEK